MPGTGWCVAVWSEITAGSGPAARQRVLDIGSRSSGLNLGTGGIYFGPADRVAALLNDMHSVTARGRRAVHPAVEHQVSRSPTPVARTDSTGPSRCSPAGPMTHAPNASRRRWSDR